MAFFMKDFRSSVASMINWMRATTQKITDYNVGSVARTLIEGPAIEIEEAYQQFLIGTREAMKVAVFSSFEFDLLPPVPAGGLVRVSIGVSPNDVVIPSNTSFTIAGRAVSYLSTQDRTIAAGSTFVDVPVAATEPGPSGNIPALQAFGLAPLPENFSGAENAAAFVNGAVAEKEEQRKLRFNEFIASLARGTSAALIYGLKQAALSDAAGNVTERVRFVNPVEPYLLDDANPTGWVQCYVHNGVGATSSGLLARAVEVAHGYVDADGKKVPGYKAAGVRTDVLAAADVEVDVTAVLELMPGFSEDDVLPTAEAFIGNYIQGLDIGESLIWSELVAILKRDVDGVHDVEISEPTDNVEATATEKLLPGDIALSS